jgi:2-oxoglutarate dehydrogenase E2 component (dihydrolipoamide succinyltransferase)
MPQLGETVAEGTVLRWLKRVGDHVADQEPLLEIATDKVDTEIPSPAGGVLDEIVIGEDETVDVGTVLAHLLPVGTGTEQAESPPVADPLVVRAVEHEPSLPAADPHAPDAPLRAAPPQTGPRHRHSPRVRRLAHENGVDLFSITGTGPGGRVTPQDVTRATTPEVVADPRTSSRVAAEAGAARMFRTIVVDVDLPLQHRTAPPDTASAGAIPARQGLPAFVASSVTAVVGALRGQPALLAPGDHGGGVDVAVSWTTESGSHSRLIANAHELNAEGVGQRVHGPTAPNADLGKAHFLLSFLLDDDVLLEVGEPPPGHAATVTFGAPTQRVVVVEADGSPSIGIRRRAYVSVSYDPNALGREVAVSFLRDLARRVASLT